MKRGKNVTPQLIGVGRQERIQVKILSRPERVHMPNIARSPDGCVPICKVVDLADGAEKLLILPTVLERVIADLDQPVGRAYEIESHGIREGKNYHDLSVWELEEE